MLPRDLQAAAAKLWPDNEYLQREWIRAVMVVRSTKRGWVAEDHCPRLEVPR